LDAFGSLPAIVSVLERGVRRAVGVTVEGVPVELVVADPERFGTELLRATGTHAYVDALGDLPAASDEVTAYGRLGLPFCPPELREAPFRGEPPELLTRDEIRGDLHVHTSRADGTLDLPDDVLAELEWVQLSLHAGQRQKRDELTRKVTEAMRHPAVRALSHPQGRMINHRPPNALDLERTFEVALETGVALETNGLPDRLDLSGPNIKLAIEAGVPIVVSTDAHSVRGLGNMRLAVHTARRGTAAA